MGSHTSYEWMNDLPLFDERFLAALGQRTMNTHPAGTGPNANRRGMLLLMVLTMLSLFLLMGTLAIVLAIRSRETARAFAGSIAGPTQMPAIARAAADEALLILLRGSTDATVKKAVNKSLLADMYETPLEQRYDAFDDANPFLTRLRLSGTGDGLGQVIESPRPAFRTGSNATLSIEADNDNDGSADGVWLEKVLPPMNMPGGGELTFKVSYLVLDLDGRINVNAHGRRSDDPKATADPDGPADISAPAVVGGTSSTPWQFLLSGAGSQLPTSGSASPSVQWRPAPALSNQAADGRFASATSAKTYDLRLDLEAPRPAVIAGATGQNPFTIGELERVLRQFDSDAGTLPPRLAAILNTYSERSRMRITTDSWDAPGPRTNIKWAAPNFQEDWTTLVPVIVSAGATQGEAEQWVANLIEFRDNDMAANTYHTGIIGVEPTSVSIPGPWNLGSFQSPAQALGVPMGTLEEIKERQEDGEPVKSLAYKHPKILELITVPSLFNATITADPKREPGRINVNTCDRTVWAALINKDLASITATEKNPYLPDDPDDPTNPVTPVTKPAKTTLDLLKNKLIFSDTSYDVSKIDHSMANRFANAASVRSHVFAIWITVQITNSSATDATPSCHRLFAIVDRSIPVTYAEGQNNNVRDMIRLQRFLN